MPVAPTSSATVFGATADCEEPAVVDELVAFGLLHALRPRPRASTTAPVAKAVRGAWRRNQIGLMIPLPPRPVSRSGGRDTISAGPEQLADDDGDLVEDVERH